MGFTGGSDGQESACNAWDLSFIPGLGRSSKEGNGYPLQYSCLENSVDRGAWQATVHGVPKSQTCLNDFHSRHFTSWWQRASGRKYPPLWQRGLWIPERCELWVWSLQSVERNDSLPCAAQPPLPLPSQGLWQRDAAAPSADFPPPSLAQPTSHKSRQVTRELLHTDQAEVKRLNFSLGTQSHPFVSTWSLHDMHIGGDLICIQMP